MNFISTFDELNKLYEEVSKEPTQKTEEGYVAYYGPDGSEKKAPQWWLDKGGTDASWREQQRINNSGKHDEETGKYIWGNQRLRCAAEDTNEGEDLVEAADEAADEPKQVIVECDKCGALVIVDEADIVVDEKTDLVNVDTECKFCEETAGYKIIGALAPYGDDEEIEIVDDEEIEVFDDEDDIVEEGLADFARKVFDKPASIATQQSWEDELNDDSTTPERRAELEKKFAQQRDWEAKHPDKEVK